MGWTAPAAVGTDWSVGELVVASKMNSHLSDNLRYLKGMDGAVVIEDRVNIPLTSAGNGKGLRFGDGTNQYANLQGLDAASNSFVFFATNRQYDGSAWQQLNARAGGVLQIVQDALTYSTFPAASSTPAERFRVTNAGFLGLGGIAPAGLFHALGVGGGLVFLTATAVAGLQTIAVAGTVAHAAGIIAVFDYANTGGASNIFTTLGRIALASSGTYINGDTITVAVTAGGAITVQRTTGSASTHEISMLVLYN